MSLDKKPNPNQVSLMWDFFWSTNALSPKKISHIKRENKMGRCMTHPVEEIQQEQTCTVFIHPGEKQVVVPRGTTLLQAAVNAG